MDASPLAAGVLASWAALTPSLVPRRWWMTGISVATASAAASGVAQASRAAVRAAGRGARGQSRRRGLGGIHDLVRARAAGRPEGHRNALGLLRTAAAAGVIAGVGVSLSDSVRWQADVARRTGVREASPLHHLSGYAVGLAGWAVLQGAGQLSRGLRRRLVARLVRHLPLVPPALVGAVAAAVALRLYGWMVAGALMRADQSAVIQSFARLGVGPGPAERARSGSPESAEPFATMGLHGRAFVTGGPRRARIREVWGALAQDPGRTGRVARSADGAAASAEAWEAGPGGRGTAEPIRVFAGRLGHPDPREAASAVLAELERTGAFSRRAILLVTGTGSGWVPPWSTSAFEYLMRGDCAVASAQYSFADSWLAFLIHRRPAREVSREVLTAVRRRLRQIPSDRRPRLFLAGESLGAYGGLGAFGSPGALLRAVDGAVWTGTPRSARVLGRILRDRRHGSTEVRPVYGTGRHIRFVTRPWDLAEAPRGFAYSPWEAPRVVFAQHGSDPVVWWDPAVLLCRPDWLREERSPDVSPGVRWRPLATFWQLTADMPRSVDLPGGRGHSYHEETVHYWNAVLGTGLSAADCDEIARAISIDLAPLSGTLPLTDTGARLRGGSSPRTSTPQA